MTYARYYWQRKVCHVLGKFEGEPLSCTITYSDSPSGTIHLYAYELNLPGYVEAINTLSQRQLNVTHYDDTSLEGTVDAGEGGFLLLTIPYTEGFRLEVDGVQTELESVGDALCGVILRPHALAHAGVIIFFSSEGGADSEAALQAQADTAEDVPGEIPYDETEV